MQIIYYSDLHLEFGLDWVLPEPTTHQILILAGDIISFNDYTPLERLLSNWTMPVIYVAGNHEYYDCNAMEDENQNFKEWLRKSLPQVNFLQDEEFSISGINFFGGTMWTDFANGDSTAMSIANQRMNDFRLIRTTNALLSPQDTINLHLSFRRKLIHWLTQPLKGSRVIVSHHAPVNNPRTKYKSNSLTSAFVAQDMREIIELNEPALWIYGHTHECDDQKIGKTRIVSNQLGYPPHDLRNCGNFDPSGRPINL